MQNRYNLVKPKNYLSGGNMKTSHILAVLLLCIFSSFLSACQGDFSRSDGTSLETINAEQIADMIESAQQSAQAETTAEPESSAVVEQTEPPLTSSPDSETVYWTEGGEVWHITASCSSLAKAEQIFSGSTEDAIAHGKTRVCKRCG